MQLHCVEACGGFVLRGLQTPSGWLAGPRAEPFLSLRLAPGTRLPTPLHDVNRPGHGQSGTKEPSNTRPIILANPSHTPFSQLSPLLSPLLTAPVGSSRPVAHPSVQYTPLFWLAALGPEPAICPRLELRCAPLGAGLLWVQFMPSFWPCLHSASILRAQACAMPCVRLPLCGTWVPRTSWTPATNSSPINTCVLCTCLRSGRRPRGRLLWCSCWVSRLGTCHRATAYHYRIRTSLPTARGPASERG